MSKALKAVVLSVSMAIVLFTIAGGLRVRAESNDGAYRQLGVYSEVLSRIRSESVEEPNIPAVSDKTLEEGVGYIKVDAFTQGKSQEIANKIKGLQSHGVKKLILDVRDCSAGDEKEGIATANLFLNHGIIAYLQGQRYPKE